MFQQGNTLLNLNYSETGTIPSARCIIAETISGLGLIIGIRQAMIGAMNTIPNQQGF